MRIFQVFKNKQWIDIKIDDLKDGDIIRIFDDNERYINEIDNSNTWKVKGACYTNKDGIKTVKIY